MMRTSVKSLAMASALVLLVQVALGGLEPAYKCKFQKSDGVTDVKTTGSFEMAMLEDDMMFRCTVKLQNIKGMVNGHIHIGGPGQNGGVAVPAFQGPIPPFSGKDFLYRFDFNASAINMTTLDNMGYYFNVHTKKFPVGEVRCNPKKV